MSFCITFVHYPAKALGTILGLPFMQIRAGGSLHCEVPVQADVPMARWGVPKMNKRESEGIVTKSSSSDPAWWVSPKYNLSLSFSYSDPSYHTLLLPDLTPAYLSSSVDLYVAILCLLANVCTAHCPLFLECPSSLHPAYFSRPNSNTFERFTWFLPCWLHTIMQLWIYTLVNLYFIWTAISLSQANCLH